MFNLDPKKMQAMMKQMGINQQEIPSSRVIIEKEDGGKIIISNPSVVKITAQGQDSFQVAGSISENNEEGSETTDEDIETVMEKTGSTREQAITALKNNGGDLAEAIIELGE